MDSVTIDSVTTDKAPPIVSAISGFYGSISGGKIARNSFISAVVSSSRAVKLVIDSMAT